MPVKSARIKWIIGVLLAFSVLIAYWQVQYCDYVGFDDELYVTENRKVQEGLSGKGIVWAFTTLDAANWHPLTWLSHMLDVQLYGLNSGGHHWTSLQLHLANSLLLFFILNRMTGALWRSAFIAALFGLHPLHVESVAWIAERKDVLSTFFGFLAIDAYRRYTESRRPGMYGLAFIFLCLGLMSKPMLVTLPFVFLLLDIWPLKRWEPSGRKGMPETEKPETLKYLIVEKMPLMIPVAVSSVLTLMAQKGGGAMGTLTHFPLTFRIGNAFTAYTGYLQKFFWPRDLTVFYPHPGFSLNAWQVGAAAAVIVGMCVFAALVLRRYPYVATGWLFYLGTLVPVIGLVQVGEQAMADRYTYIPLIGIFIIVSWGSVDLLKKFPYHRQILFAAVAVIVPVMVVLTQIQVGYWKNGITLFERAIEITGDSHWAHNNLGTAHGKLNNRQAALFHYREAVRIKPDYDTALYNLGSTLAQNGDFNGGRIYLARALELNPADTDVRNNLANILVSLGQDQEAIHHYREILRTDPDSPDVHSNLGNIMARQGRTDSAVFHYREAIRLDPLHADAHYNLGTLLVQLQKTSEAVVHFSAAIRSDTGYAKAYNALGVLFARQGQRERAALFFREALRIRPDYRNARENLVRLKH